MNTKTMKSVVVEAITALRVAAEEAKRTWPDGNAWAHYEEAATQLEESFERLQHRFKKLASKILGEPCTHI